jgi:hypothetical protein
MKTQKIQPSCGNLRHISWNLGGKQGLSRYAKNKTRFAFCFRFHFLFRRLTVFVVKER